MGTGQNRKHQQAAPSMLHRTINLENDYDHNQKYGK